MNPFVRIAVLAVAALTIAATPEGAWPGGRGGGGHGRGARGGHHHHARSFGGFFVGAPLYPYPYYYYGSPPYYYGYGQPQYAPASVYVEKFEGTPTSETQGEVFCADREAYYPDVHDCPGGWQRVFRAPQASAPAGSS
jgi:hypothetical protein